MTAPHPLRCETCDHFEGHSCKYLGDRLANVEIVHIERVGCASHSSLTAKAGHCGHEWCCPSYWPGESVALCGAPCMRTQCPHNHDTRRQPDRVEKGEILDEHWISAQEEFMFVDDLTGKEVYGVRSEQLKRAIALLRGDEQR